MVCASIDVPDGWYASLFFDRDKAIEYDPTIADVHTQPADEFGAVVGNVLHVATGYPRLMVVSVDTCAGPRAYAGVVFAYHERIEGDFTRLSDQSWANLLDSGDPQPDVGWMQALLP